MPSERNGTNSASPATTRKQAIMQAEDAYLARTRTQARLAAAGVYVFGPIQALPQGDSAPTTPDDPFDKAVDDLGSRIDPFIG